MKYSNMYGLDFIAFKGILETLIKTVRTENKKKAEKLKLEETKLQEENWCYFALSFIYVNKQP